MRPSRVLPRAASAAVIACLCIAAIGARGQASELRRSAIVKAVEGARWSVVNIHGQKMMPVETNDSQPVTRAVNGMGTGVVIDRRGYVMTNFHVVDGVKRIQVTNAAGQTSIAKLIARDPVTDVAIVKIPQDERLQVVPLGSSHDLMVGEDVVAMGNAYGYNHSVTRGIISALHRDVPISETQRYYDLIQTDASINPGNSGGPLLNIDGQMIGLNVAVRVGAQGIGFAIPIDQVVEIAAELLRQQRQQDHWHGVAGEMRITGDKPSFRVQSVETDSPAAKSGIQPGDVITRVGESEVHNALEFELALLDRPIGEEVQIATLRDDESKTVRLSVEAAPAGRQSSDVVSRAWRIVGLRLSPVSAQELGRTSSRYRGGLQITAVRPGSPAEREHIQPGDILVGMHVWETISLENLGYVLSQPDFDDHRPVKCFILRDDRTHYAFLPLQKDGLR